MKNNYKYLIIGGSVAGIAAVEGIREVDKKGSIGLISYEPYHAYSRPMISNYLMEDIGIEDMYYRPLEFYDQEHVDTFLGRRVVAIDPEERRVDFEDKDSLFYENLLVASGGRPIVPRIGGVDKKGVYSFLSFDNAKEIKSSIDDIERAVVIGGGLSGMKASEALCKVGIRVSVVEMLDRVLAPVYDRKGTEIIREVFEEKGVEIYTSSQAEEIYGREGKEDRVGGVALKGGMRLPADIVILAVGVIPQTDFLKDTGIEMNRGISVDETMKTSLPHVYAAGDVAEAYDIITGVRRLIPIWPKAYYEGRTAGLNMAGRHEEFKGIFPMNSADFFGLPTMSAGVVNPEDEGAYEMLVDYRPESRYYKKLLIRDEKIDGMIMIGDAVDRAGIILGLIRERANVQGFKDRLLDEHFSLADLPEPIRRARIRGVA